MSGGIGSIISKIFGSGGGEAGGGLVGSLLGGSDSGGGQQKNGFGSFNKATYGPGVDIGSGLSSAITPQFSPIGMEAIMNTQPRRSSYPSTSQQSGDENSLGTLLGSLENRGNGLRMSQMFSGMEGGLGSSQPQNPGLNSLMSMAMSNAAQGHRRQPYAFRSAYLQRLLQQGRL